MKFIFKKYFKVSDFCKQTILNYSFNFFNIYYSNLNHIFFFNNIILVEDSSIKNYFCFKYYLFLLKIFKVASSLAFNFYKRYKFITFIGLGFKKRLERRYKNIFLFFGHRHWITFNIPKKFLIYFIKRKNLIMYSNKKYILNNFMLSFKNFKKESIFKIKGVLDVRSKKRWLFMRRSKIRGLRIKLSKKQKLL